MYTFVLADWTTLRGTSASPAVPIVQAEDTWLDLAAYRDLVIVFDVRELTGISTWKLETSPTKDEPLFVTTYVDNVGGVRGGIVLARGNASPPTRFARWKVTPGNGVAFSFTFRAFVCANPAPAAGARLAGIG